MVLTIKPGICISEEELGVCIEDDVLVTGTGHEVMTSGVPKMNEPFEYPMAEEGIDPPEYVIRL